jgi:hypothetical protein
MLLSTNDKRIIVLLPLHFDLQTTISTLPLLFPAFKKTGYHLPKNSEKDSLYIFI